MRDRDLEQAAVGERRGSGEAFEEDARERVDVARRACRLAADQLGRDVIERPHHLAGRRQHRVRPSLGEPEVRHGRTARRVEHHVRGLHVPVNDPARVQRVEAGRDLRGEPEALIEGQRAGRLDAVAERASLDVGDREIVVAAGLTGLEDRDEVRVPHLLGDACFAEEALAVDLVLREELLQHLQGDDRPVLARRREHDADRSLSEHRLEAVRPEGVAELEVGVSRRSAPRPKATGGDPAVTRRTSRRR